MSQRYYLGRDWRMRWYLVPIEDEVAFEGQAMDHGPAPESAIPIPGKVEDITFENPLHRGYGIEHFDGFRRG